jgi:hypothetical protein
MMLTRREFMQSLPLIADATGREYEKRLPIGKSYGFESNTERLLGGDIKKTFKKNMNLSGFIQEEVKIIYSYISFHEKGREKYLLTRIEVERAQEKLVLSRKACDANSILVLSLSNGIDMLYYRTGSDANLVYESQGRLVEKSIPESVFDELVHFKEK